MTVISCFFSKKAFIFEATISIIAIVLIVINTFNFKAYVKSILISSQESLRFGKSSFFQSIKIPLVIVGQHNEIIWANTAFQNVICNDNYLGVSISNFTSGIELKKILINNGTNISYNNTQYTAFATQNNNSYIVLFINDNNYKQTAYEYSQSRPIVASIMFDNKDELINEYDNDGNDTQVVAMVEMTLQKWASKTNGFLKKLNNGRYIMIFEERHLKTFIEEKFDILDAIRNIKLDDHRYATISIGIGKSGKNFAECEQWSRKALDMALGRGGDQVAIKQGEKYEFFGGVSKGVEKKDRVRTRVIANSLSESIKSSDCVFIMGHKFSDLDCLGASIGLWCAITKGLEKPAYIIINEEETLAAPLIQSLETYETRTAFISPNDALELLSDRSLLVILDTHSKSFVESAEVYEKCKRFVVIDHHRMMVEHIGGAIIFYHDPYASSASEMVTELVQYIADNSIDRLSAEALLAGIMLDTKNFVLKTGVRTFEAAAFLRKKGADTVEVKRLFSDSIDTYKVKYQLISCAEIYNSCAVVCAEDDYQNIRIAAAQAADELLGIQGVDASFVIYNSEDTINISARSLGSINVQILMEKLGGGGHQTMAGVQIKDSNMNQVRSKLISLISSTDIYNTKI